MIILSEYGTSRLLLLVFVVRFKNSIRKGKLKSAFRLTLRIYEVLQTKQLQLLS